MMIFPQPFFAKRRVCQGFSGRLCHVFNVFNVFHVFYFFQGMGLRPNVESAYASMRTRQLEAHVNQSHETPVDVIHDGSKSYLYVGSHHRRTESGTADYCI